MWLLMTLLGCGIVTEQECDECVEYARFADACHDFLKSEYDISLACSVDLEYEPDRFCTQSFVEENQNRDNLSSDEQRCIDAALNGERLGWYMYTLDDFNVIGSSTCESQWDYYSGCQSKKRAKKKAMNAAEQFEYYQSDECRRWFWDSKELWALETAVEKRDCEEFYTLLTQGLYYRSGMNPL